MREGTNEFVSSMHHKYLRTQQYTGCDALQLEIQAYSSVQILEMDIWI